MGDESVQGRQPGAEPASHRLRRGRFGFPGTLVIVTKCRHRRRRINLTARSVARIIVRALLAARESERCHLLAWCLMPDHIHIFLNPRELVDGSQGLSPVGARSSGRLRRNLSPLSRFVADWASTSAHLVNKAVGEKGPLWQKGFHDHALRRTERIEDVVEYIHCNPVRRGSVTDSNAWPWSSANPRFAEATDWDWYVGNRPEDGAPTKRPSEMPAQRNVVDNTQGRRPRQ